MSRGNRTDAGRFNAVGGKRMRGVFSVEFALVLFVAMTVFAFIGEFLRISMIDQALARATHMASRAVATATTSVGCHAVATDAINEDLGSNWALDSNNDGIIEFHVETTDGWPDPTNAGEVLIAISWDTDPADAGGVDWSDATGSGCGGTDSWLRVRTRIAVRPWFAPFRAAVPGGIVLRHESWGRNDRI